MSQVIAAKNVAQVFNLCRPLASHSVSESAKRTWA